MEREPGAAGMVTAGGVDEEHVGALWQSADGRREERALTQSEEAGLVGSRCATRQRRGGDQAPAANERRAGPGRFAAPARACISIDGCASYAGGSNAESEEEEDDG